MLVQFEVKVCLLACWGHEKVIYKVWVIVGVRYCYRLNQSLLCPVCAGFNLTEGRVCWRICHSQGRGASTVVVDVRCCPFQSICN